MKNNLPTIGSFEVLRAWIAALAINVGLCASLWESSLDSMVSVIDLYLPNPLDLRTSQGISTAALQRVRLRRSSPVVMRKSR